MPRLTIINVHFALHLSIATPMPPPLTYTVLGLYEVYVRQIHMVPHPLPSCLFSSSYHPRSSRSPRSSRVQRLIAQRWDKRDGHTARRPAVAMTREVSGGLTIDLKQLGRVAQFNACEKPVTRNSERSTLGISHEPLSH